MGKRLIIHGSDFSANAASAMPGEIPYKKSGFCIQYLDYNGNTLIQQLNGDSPVATNTRLLVCDVSNFIGMTISITSANYVLEGAQYDAFVSDLGDLTFDGIPDLAPIPPKQPTIFHSVTAIESFNVTTTTTGEVATIQKVVPANAKYLLVTARFNEGLTEEMLSVDVVL